MSTDEGNKKDDKLEEVKTEPEKTDSDESNESNESNAIPFEAITQPEAEALSQQRYEWVATPESNRKRNFLLISIAGLLTLSVALFIAYYQFDLFKSNKTIYLESELVSAGSFAANVRDSVEFVSQNLSKTIRTQDEISFNMDTTESLGETGDAIVQFINNTAFINDTIYNEDQQSFLSKLGVKTDGKQWLDLELFSEKNVIGGAIPSIAKDKYIKIDLNNKQLAEKLGLTEIMPDKIMTTTDFLEAIRLNREELEPITSHILGTYTNNISNEQVVIEKDVKLTIGDQTINTRKVTLTFSDQQFEKLVDEMAKGILLDADIQNLIYNRYDKFVKLFANSGLPVEAPMSKAELVAAMKDAYDDLKKELDVKTKDGIRMILHIDGDKLILKREIVVADETTDFLLDFESLDGKEKGFTAISLKVDDREADSKLDFSFKNEEKTEGDRNVQNVQVAMKLDEPDASSVDKRKETSVDWQSTLNTVEKGDNLNSDFTFSFAVKDPEQGDDIKLTGSLTDDRTTTEENVRYDSKFTLSFQEIPQLAEGFPVSSVSVRVKGNTSYPDSIILPALTSKNALDLAKVSDEQIATAAMIYYSDFVQFLENNSDALSPFMPFIDSFMGLGGDTGEEGMDDPENPENVEDLQGM